MGRTFSAGAIRSGVDSWAGGPRLGHPVRVDSWADGPRLIRAPMVHLLRNSSITAGRLRVRLVRLSDTVRPYSGQTAPFATRCVSGASATAAARAAATARGGAAAILSGDHRARGAVS
jgi:hypothetical protein